MLFGSYLAGSTPVGGGSVAFPILVLLLGEPAALGRSFALAIQALGMSSAVLYLLASRRPLAWGVLRWALLGSLLATPVGVTWLAPGCPSRREAVHAAIWAGFGGVTLLRLSELAGQTGMRSPGPGGERATGLLVGAVGGGVVASVAGVGADMLLYSVLCCSSAPMPGSPSRTAVALMAFTSLVGVATHALLATLDPSVPLLPPGVGGPLARRRAGGGRGAPLGALAVSAIPRTATLALVALLCLGQLAWVCVQARLSPPVSRGCWRRCWRSAACCCCCTHRAGVLRAARRVTARRACPLRGSSRSRKLARADDPGRWERRLAVRRTRAAVHRRHHGRGGRAGSGWPWIPTPAIARGWIGRGRGRASARRGSGDLRRLHRRRRERRKRHPRSAPRPAAAQPRALPRLRHRPHPDRDEAAAVVAARLASLARGYSGVRALLLERLCELPESPPAAADSRARARSARAAT